MKNIESAKATMGTDKEMIPLEEMADKLNELQSVENDGRGISCVRTIITFLKLGDLASARQTAMWDHDKIVNYPLIMIYIKDELFKGEDEHPWSILERMRSSE